MKNLLVILFTLFSLSAAAQQTFDFEKVTGGADVTVNGQILHFAAPAATVDNTANTVSVLIMFQVWVVKITDHITINGVLMTTQTTQQIADLLRTTVFNADSGGGLSNPMSAAGQLIFGGSLGTPTATATPGHANMRPVWDGSIVKWTDTAAGGGSQNLDAVLGQASTKVLNSRTNNFEGNTWRLDSVNLTYGKQSSVTFDASGIASDSVSRTLQYIQPYNYNPGAGIGRYMWTLGQFSGVNGAGVRSNVVQSFGFNTTAGGGKEIAGHASSRWGYESYFFIGGNPHFEYYQEIYCDTCSIGHRPWAYYGSQTSGGSFAQYDLESSYIRNINGKIYFSVDQDLNFFSQKNQGGRFEIQDSTGADVLKITNTKSTNSVVINSDYTVPIAWNNNLKITPNTSAFALEILPSNGATTGIAFNTNVTPTYIPIQWDAAYAGGVFAFFRNTSSAAGAFSAFVLNAAGGGSNANSSPFIVYRVPGLSVTDYSVGLNSLTHNFEWNHNTSGLMANGLQMSLTDAGKLLLPGSTTASATFNITSGTAPTSPVNGDIYQDGTNVFMRIGGAWKQLNN